MPLASIRHRPFEKVAERKPFAGAAQHKIFSNHAPVLRIAAFLHDDVRAITIARHDFIGLPPRGEADEFHVQIVIGEIVKIQAHGASFTAMVTPAPGSTRGSDQPPPSAR